MKQRAAPSKSQNKSRKKTTSSAESLSPRVRQLNDERGILINRVVGLRDESEICKIKARCNMKTLINALLPPNILLIFSFAKNAQVKKTGIYGSHEVSYPGSIRISHVCSHWRKIALAHPSLWTIRFPTNVEGIKTFLERSKTEPVVLDSTITKKLLSHPSHNAVLFSNLFRVTEVDMSVSEKQLDSVAAAFDIGTPYLKVLRIEMEIRPSSKSKPSVLLPPPPNPTELRRVSCAFKFDWSRAQLGNLTELCLIGTPKAAKKLSTQQLATILEHSPQLVTINLEHAVHEKESGNQATNRKLSLLHLKSLSIQSDGSATTKLLIGLATLPNLERLKLVIRTTEKQVIFDILSAAVALPQFKHPESIMAKAQERDGDKTFTYTSTQLSAVRMDRNSCTLSFQCSWDANLGDVLDAGRLVFYSVAKAELRELTSFEFTAPRLLSARLWIWLFKRMKSLRTLSVQSDHDLVSILDALTPHLDDDYDFDEPNPRPFLLPNIYHLKLLCDIDQIDLYAIGQCMELRGTVRTLELPGFTSDYEDLFEFQWSGLCMVKGIQGRHRLE